MYLKWFIKNKMHFFYRQNSSSIIHHSSFIIHHLSFTIHKKGPERKSEPLKEIFVKRSIKNYISHPAEPGISMQTDRWYKQTQVF